MLIMQGLELEELQCIFTPFATIHKTLTTGVLDTAFELTLRRSDCIRQVFRKPKFWSITIGYDTGLTHGPASKNYTFPGWWHYKLTWTERHMVAIQLLPWI
jgi:hypothetical protein